jgi:formylglycine-generating enzyme required for sulfatase activity
LNRKVAGMVCFVSKERYQLEEEIMKFYGKSYGCQLSKTCKQYGHVNFFAIWRYAAHPTMLLLLLGLFLSGCVNYTLDITIEGEGTVAQVPEPQENGAYENGTEVTLTATAAEGWYLSAWTGATENNGDTATVVMDGNKSVTATFAPWRTLGITVEGSGTVMRDPDSELYKDGETITLTAIPDSDSYFVRWSGDLEIETATATLVMNANKSVTAVFAKLKVLEVNIDGAGTVTLNPDGGKYKEGETVTLTAVPDTDSRFVRWSGDLTSDIATETLLMDGDKTVNAWFRSGVLTSDLKADGLYLRAGPDQVTVEWEPSTDYAVKDYRIYRGVELEGTYESLGFSGGAVIFEDTRVTRKQRYYYQVYAVNTDDSETLLRGTGSVVAGVVSLWLPPLGVAPGQELRIPINASNASGIGPRGIQIDFHFPSNVLDSTTLRVERTVVTRYMLVNWNLLEDGILRVIALGETSDALLVGEGHLFNVFMRTAESESDDCGDLFLEGTRIFDERGDPVDAIASGDGFVCVGDATQELLKVGVPQCVPGDLDDDGEVTVGDAIKALRVAVKLDSLEADSCKQLSCDLNGDGRIDAADTVLILRTTLGMPLNPPQDNEKALEVQNWPLEYFSAEKATGEVYVELPRLEAAAGAIIEVPLTVSDASGLGGLDVTVSWPTQLASLIENGVVRGDLTEQFRLETSIGEGFVRFSMGNDTALDGGGQPIEGSVAILKLRIANDAPVNTRIPLRLSAARLRGQFGESFDWYDDIYLADGQIRILEATEGEGEFEGELVEGEGEPVEGEGEPVEGEGEIVEGEGEPVEGEGEPVEGEGEPVEGEGEVDPCDPDLVAPVITLQGEANVEVECDGTYVDAGASASDACDGDLNTDIVVSGDTVDTSTPGIYTLYYNVTDANSNSAVEVTRTVTVLDNCIEEITILLPGDVPLILVQVPAGTFMMGRYSGEQSSQANEDPQHTVTLPQDLFMGKYPVTQEQWMAVMGSWPSTAPSSQYGLGDDYPAYNVSWNDAKNFITALNTHLTNTSQGPATLRLPSEAEWEYACRADTTTRFYFGDSLSCADDCSDCSTDGLAGNRSNYMWYCGNNTTTGTKPVGGKLPNDFGLYDMHGNLYEWIEDDWHTSYTGAPGDGTVWLDTPRATYRVLRGGSWNSQSNLCRSARRDPETPSYAGEDVGFRVCR